MHPKAIASSCNQASCAHDEVLTSVQSSRDPLTAVGNSQYAKRQPSSAQVSRMSVGEQHKTALNGGVPSNIRCKASDALMEIVQR